MADNEFIARGEEPVEEVHASKKKPTKKKTEKKPSASVPVWDRLRERIDTKKARVYVGATLIVMSIFLFLACFSYLFTWQADQNRVLGKGFWEFILDANEEPLENWLGKFGAWSSHLLIYRWFGLASFTLPLVFFVLGFRTLFKINILPLSKTLTASALFTVWFSAFFGFFASELNYLGGTFGFQVNEWLSLTIGKFGTLILIIACGYVFLMITFNEQLMRFLQYLGWLRKKSEADKDTLNPEDMSVSNILDPSLQKEDLIARTVYFTEEDDNELIEEDEEDPEDHSEVIDELEDEEEDDSIQFMMPENMEPREEEEFSVEIAEQKEDDAALDDEDVNKLRQEYGEYDPKLDLASYALPPIELLKEYGSGSANVDKSELEENKNKIVQTLLHYKIEIAKIRATVGPTVTLYEIVPAPGVRISKIKNLEDDIALSLAALGIRIIAPIPGKGTIGIEVPNSKPEMVSMRSLIASKKFQESDYELPVVMGKTITNETYTFDLTKMPHLLVAGATGQGKSVGLNAILISLLYKKHPSQVKFVLVDPKKVELTLYNRIERHFLAKLPDEEDAIITDTSKVVNTLNSLCIEMDDRYELLKTAHVRTIKEYNQKFIDRKLNPEKGHRYLPYIVVLIDEFADLIMTAGKEVEQPIARIAQLARAVGIHLIVATQRPSVNVITGMIKANFPARIAFRVLSKIDSRTILDASGADQLIGRGDMLISTGQDLIRLQCGFVDTPEVDDICSFIGDQRGYPSALHLPEYVGEGAESGGAFDDDELDPLFADAARIVVMHQQGSASLLQRKLKLGYNRAGRIIDQLEGLGVIGPFRGSKARDVLFTDEMALEDYLRNKGLI
jgi:S-DNA-T family DNA segregation ATPase FtsK/SpoIIIE